MSVQKTHRASFGINPWSLIYTSILKILANGGFASTASGMIAKFPILSANIKS